MPSIQFNLPVTVAPATKQALAERVGEIYAEIMQADKDLITVSVHDLGEGGVWRCHEDGPPTPSSLIMCNIRSGRRVETRARLARSLIDTCVAMFALDEQWVKVEFTQHPGNEMYYAHLGRFNVDWKENEETPHQLNEVRASDT